MSLINDMLRDLDTRRSTSMPGNLHGYPATGSTARAIPAKRSKRTLAWLGLPAIILTALLVFSTYTPDRNTAAATVITMQLPLPPNAAGKRRLKDRIIVARNAGRSQPATSAAPVGTSGASEVSAEPDSGKQAADAQQRIAARHDTGKPDGLDDDLVNQQAVIDSDPPDTGNNDPAIVMHQRDAWQVYHLAASDAAAGNIGAATSRLEENLAIESDHHDSRLLLARLYIRQRDNERAEELLLDGLSRDRTFIPFAQMLARLLGTAGRFDEAITHLQTALPSAANDAGYHALLAALHQRNDAHTAAVHHYSIAVGISPDHGEWWMGLGISHEQSGNHPAARTAFRQALQHPLEDALQHYIRERLAHLAAHTQTGGIKTTGPGEA